MGVRSDASVKGALKAKGVPIVDIGASEFSGGHALWTECNPVRDIHIHPGAMNIPLTPYIANHPLRELGGVGGNVLFDHTWPVERTEVQRPHRLRFKNTYNEELKAKVIENWDR